MKITGPYKMDQNFIYVFVGDTKYIIAKNGDQWGSVTVGKPTAWKNQIWTKEQHEAEKADCSEVGTFELD